MKNLLPPGYQNIQPYVFEFMKWLADTQGWIIGSQDVLALTKAKQIPSEGTMEKMLQMAGPLSQDMAREMEQAMRDAGDLRRWLNCQFRTKKDVLRMLGDDGLSIAKVDFDPISLVPSHLEGEDPTKPSSYTLIERAKEVCSQTVYHVIPGSMARMTQSYQKQMLILLMKQTGFPVDPWTLADLWEIDNFGPKPDDGDTILKRWILWQEFMAELAQKGGGPQGEKRGRPSKPNGSAGGPRLKSKDSGTRVTAANG
jgi:hypothetical protein